MPEDPIRAVPNRHPDSPLTILDYSRIAWRARWKILVLVLISAVLTGIVSKLSPTLYEAKVSSLPVREDSFGGGGLSFGSGGGGKESGSASMSMDALSGKGGPSLMDTLLVLLNSRLMAEEVIKQLNLMQYYKTDSKRAAANALLAEISVNHSVNKTIEITVITSDPVMAADIANAYFPILDRLNREYTITSVKRNRMFIEARLAEKTKKLKEAEDTLKNFQTANRTLEIQGAAVAAMGAAADLRGQIVALEVELASLTYATPDHPMINQLQTQIHALEKQLDRMEQDQVRAIGKRARARAPMSAKLFPSFEEAPSLALDFLRLTRQLKVEEAVYAMLVGMLEQAKIAETRDMPTIQVMDKAIPPERKSRPKTLQNVQTAAVLSLIFGILLAFFLNYLEQIKAQEMMQGLPVNGGDGLPLDPNGNGSKLEGHPMATSKKLKRLLQGP